MIKKIAISGVILLGLLFNGLIYASTQEEGCELNGVDYKQAQTLTQILKAALLSNDKNAIANLISYPLRVNTTVKGKLTHYFITDKKQFISSYTRLFNADIKQAILDDNGLFCNYQGAMLGSGSVWFRTDDDGTKIFSINN